MMVDGLEKGMVGPSVPAVPAVCTSHFLCKVVCFHRDGRPQAMASLMCSASCKVMESWATGSCRAKWKFNGGKVRGERGWRKGSRAAEMDTHESLDSARREFVY